MPFDQGGQLDGQLIQIGDIQEGIAVDTFDAGLVVADGGGCEKNLFAGVFLLDAAKVFFGCGAVVAGVCGLAVGDQDQELYRFRTPRKLLRNVAQSGTVTVAVAGGDVHKRDLVGKIVLAEDLAVGTVQRVAIETTADKKPGLLSAATAVLELSNDALLELLGYRKQGSGDLIVLLNQRFIHARNTIDPYLNPAVDIPIGDALRSFVELGQTLIFKLCTGRAFGHFVQDTFNITGGLLVFEMLIVLITLYRTVEWVGAAVGLFERNAPDFLLTGALTGIVTGSTASSIVPER